jgi:acetoin utilization deacetylase AcuC-like enzyme
VAFVLEGGYDLPTLENGVQEVLGRLSREAPSPLADTAVSPVTRRELEPCIRVFKDYWEL